LGGAARDQRTTNTRGFGTDRDNGHVKISGISTERKEKLKKQGSVRAPGTKAPQQKRLCEGEKNHAAKKEE